MFRRVSVLAAAFAACIALAALAPARQTTYRLDDGYQVREIRGTVPLAAPADLQVLSEVGNVTLDSASGDNLRYDIEIRLRGGAGGRAALDAWPVSVRRSGDLIVVSAGAAPAGAHGGVSIQLDVPAAVRLARVHTAVGNVTAGSLAGSLFAASSAGNITADAIGGSLRAETAAGNVSLGHIAGSVSASTAGGNIRLDSAGAGATLQSQGGNLTVGSAQGPVRLITAGGSIQLDSAAGDVTAETAGGNIVLGNVAGRVRSQTGGGNVQIARAAAVQCESGGGSLRLRQIAGPVRASTGAGSIFAQIVATPATFAASTLRSGVGDITVLLPPRLPVTVSVRLGDAFGHRLYSDFAALQGAAQPQDGMLIVRAPLNGGGPLLRLISSSSNISVRKER